MDIWVSNYLLLWTILLWTLLYMSWYTRASTHAFLHTLAHFAPGQFVFVLGMLSPLETNSRECKYGICLLVTPIAVWGQSQKSRDWGWVRDWLRSGWRRANRQTEGAPFFLSPGDSLTLHRAPRVLPGLHHLVAYLQFFCAANDSKGQVGLKQKANKSSELQGKGWASHRPSCCVSLTVVNIKGYFLSCPAVRG